MVLFNDLPLVVVNEPGHTPGEDGSDDQGIERDGLTAWEDTRGTLENPREFYALLTALVLVCAIGTGGAVNVAHYADKTLAIVLITALFTFLGTGMTAIIFLLKIRRVAVQGRRNFSEIVRTRRHLETKVNEAVGPIHDRLTGVEQRINGNVEGLLDKATTAVRAAEHDQVLTDPAIDARLATIVADVVRRTLEEMRDTGMLPPPKPTE